MTHRFNPLGLSYLFDCSQEAEEILRGRKGKLLSDGTVLYYYGPIMGWKWYPVAQAHFMLGLAQIWARHKDESVRRTALRVSKNLLAAGAGPPGQIGFPIRFAPLGYDLGPVWYSSLAQSYCASAFCRIALIEQDGSWAEVGRRVMRFVMHCPQICTEDKSGGCWYQEYPTVPETPVLNGHISTMFGFLDVGTALQDPDCLLYFDKGVRALSANLMKFDQGGLSLYDSRRGIIAKPSYQRLHVIQLRFLADVTGERLFAEFADRWERGFIEKWGLRAWMAYAERTFQSGIRLEGAKFPFSYFSYALGDHGLSIVQRLHRLSAGPKIG